jgi:hypothetical protein
MSNETKNQSVNLGRRRLAKGGLAGSAVLATLVSKNVLAFPYRCAISGQISGNYSPAPRRDGATESCALGPTVDNLKAGGFVNAGEAFMEVFGISSPYNYYEQDGKLTNNAGPTDNRNPQATLLQILTLPDFPIQIVTKRSLAEAAVAAYVGANTVSYPLTSGEVIGMFQAAVAGNSYPYSSSLGTVSLDPGEVEKYFRFLFGDSTIIEPFLS